jgi:hypothetical protein
MGDNANVDWEWKNTVVGEGYQARGVIRQPKVSSEKVKIMNMSLPPAEIVNSSKVEKTVDKRARSDSDDEDHRSPRKKSKKKDKKDEKKAKKERKQEKKKSKKKKSSSSHRDKNRDDDSNRGFLNGAGFNPLLQYLATSLSNKTRCFTLENE